MLNTYILIVGEKEAADNLISVRKRKDGDMGQMKVEYFIAKIAKRS